MIVRSPQADIPLPDCSLPDYIWRHVAGLDPAKPALVDGVTGRALTYGELQRLSGRLAAGLQARGFGKGEVLAIYSPNLPEYAVAFLGVALAGGVITTINPLYTVEELRFQLNDAGARLLLTVPDGLQRAREAAAASPVEQIVVFTEDDGGDDAGVAGPGVLPFARLLGGAGGAPRPVPITPRDDLIALPYSSGTTGLPKGVMLTHANLVANLEQIARTPLGSAAVEPDSVVIGVLPFFHIYGMVVIMLQALARGATVVTMARFELETFLRIVDDYRVTIARIVPPIVLALARHPLVERYRLDSLRSIFSGAAPLGDTLAAELRARLPHCRVSQGYGMTELSPVSHMNPDGPDVIDLGSIGPAIANTECAVVDLDSGEFLGPNRDGELWVRGPQVMKGYLNNPETTAATLDSDGWLHTGDIARYDDNGYFAIVDRVKELIKYKAYQIAPAELEALLLEHPRVGDAAVIGIADQEAGEVPKAFVVLKPAENHGGGHADADADDDAGAQAVEDGIRAFVADRVAPYKKLRALSVVDSIPKSPSGKILRRVLIDRERAGG